jgi:hypothetical protein
MAFLKNSLRRRFEDEEFDPNSEVLDPSLDRTINIDDIIDRLILFGEQDLVPHEISGKFPSPLTAEEIKWILVKVKDLFSRQPVLLELSAPIKVCGIYKQLSVSNLLRRHSRTILRPDRPLQIEWIPACCKLSLFRRHRRPRNE